MTNEKRDDAPFVQHWPAIRWDESAQQYYLTQILYSWKQWEEFKNKPKWVRLAVEYPAVNLPEVYT